MVVGPRGGVVNKQDGLPVWVDGEVSRVLERVPLTKTGAGAPYDEAWLQRLLQSNPGLLPIEQVESGFGRLIPVCCELPVAFGAGRSGSLDNLFVTSSGRLVLVEAKLWRNPEARREVVAQALDYASSVFKMDYEKFQQAALAGLHTGPTASSLYELVARHDPTTDETTFIDAVTRNLKSGRAIVAVVGDGIREDVLALAELLQTHAGHRFTFLLVELGVFRLEDSSHVIVPSILLKTELVERGVVELRAEGLVVNPPGSGAGTKAPTRGIGIGEDEFYDFLEKSSPGMPRFLREFLERAAELGIEPDVQGGLNLKYPKMPRRALNLGTVTKSGHLQTEPASWWTSKPIAQQYNQELAQIIGGSVTKHSEGSIALRTQHGTTPRLSNFLPAHQDALLLAMRRYIEAAVSAAEPGGNT